MSGTYIDLGPYEGRVIAMRSRTAIVYLYPFVLEAFRYGMKVMTRDGRVVKGVRVGGAGDDGVVVGVLDGEELRWGGDGRFAGPYIDDDRDIFIPERYMYTDWKDHIKMSNAEWSATFGKPHRGVSVPDR